VLPLVGYGWLASQDRLPLESLVGSGLLEKISELKMWKAGGCGMKAEASVE